MPGKKKSAPSGRPRRIPLFQGILWVSAGALILTVALGLWWWWGLTTPKIPAAPLYEEPHVLRPKEIPIPKAKPQERTAKPLARPSLPKIAIVIDDLGYDKQAASEFIELDAPLTLAFLPQAPHALEMALLAKKQGKEVLLHLPMEPHNYPKTDPGPGAFLVDMAEEDIRRTIEKNLTEFPFVLGANNHMGSRFTENREKMAIVFAALKKHHLFYMDSMTTPRSAGPLLAREFGVPYIQRNVFLDNEVIEEPIKQQLVKLVQTARTKGIAVGSAHPYPLSLKILRESLPTLKKQVEIVSLSKLLH